MRIRKVLFLTLLVALLGGHFASAATIPVTTTIQAAINSASDGDVIVIPAGTYPEQISISGFYKLTITGAGPGATIIDGTGLTGNLVNIDYSQKVTLKNLTTDGAAGSSSIQANINVVNSANINIMNCSIENSNQFGALMAFTVNGKVKGCLIQNNQVGVFLISSVKCSIMTSEITSNTVDGISLGLTHNTKITKNRITNNGTGINNLEAMATEVKQNFISENITQGIYHECYGTFGNVYVKNLIVNNIAPAPGVNVAAGIPTFVGNVISGSSAGFASIGTFTYCNFMKNTVMGNNPYGFVFADSGGYMAKNYISENGYGIFQIVGVPNVISNILTLIGNKVLNNLSSGLYSNDSSGTGILDAEKNFVADNGGPGIAFAGGLGGFVDKNRVASNTGGGLGTPPTNIMSVTKNLVTGNTAVGIGGGTFSMIYKNSVLANDAYGIYGFTSSHLEGNKVMGNTGNGIDGSLSSGSLIESNKAFGNGDGVTYFDLYDNNPDDVWLFNKAGTASLP